MPYVAVSRACLSVNLISCSQTIPLKLEKRKRGKRRKKKKEKRKEKREKKKEKDSAMYLVSLCREHLVAWPAVALFRQVAQDQELLPRKQGLLFAAKHAKEKKRRRLVLNRAKFPLFLFCPEPVSANDRVHRNSKGVRCLRV